MNKLAQEIEKKYLIKEGRTEYATEELYRLYPSIDFLKDFVLANGEPIQQGYMPIEKGLRLANTLGLKVDFKVEEARLRDRAGRLYFTLKGKGSISRSEIEREIDNDLFEQYWPSTKGKRIKKIRLERKYGNQYLEIDVFTDRDLILAEVETSSIDEMKELPLFGLDVTANKKYRNKNLAS